MNASEVLDFLLPQWSDPLQVVFLALILTMMILTIATTHWYASQSSWEKKWNGNTPNDHTDDLDIDHGSVTDIWNAVATSPEKLAEIMPGLLLVVGLLGTFLGLGLALNHASHILGQSNALSASGAANSMQDLLGLLQGLGTKFKTSTWGITGFLLLKVWSSLFRFEEKRLTWVIRKVKSELEVRKQEFRNAENAKQAALFEKIKNAADLIGDSFENQIIDLKNNDKLLHKNKIHYAEKNTHVICENLNSINNSTLAGSAAIKWLIEKNVQDVRDDLTRISTGIGDRGVELQRMLSESMSGLNKELTKITAANELGINVINSSIKQSVQDVRDELNSINVTTKASNIRMIDLLAQGLDSLRQGLNEINTAANNDSHEMRALFEQTTNDLRGDLYSIRVATETSSEAIHHFVNSTQTIINGISEAGVSMGKGANEIGQAAIGMNEGAEKIGKAANELVGAVGDFKNEFTTALDGISTDLGSAINNMSKQASQTLKEGSEKLENATEGIADALGGLSESMQRTMDDLQKSISEVQTVQQKSAERFNQSNIALTEQANENKELIENLGQNITDGMSAISDSGEKMVGIGRSLKELVPKLMTLDSLPSALHPLVNLPNQHQSLLAEVQSMRKVMESRDADTSGIQRKEAEAIIRSTDFLNQSVGEAGDLIQKFSMDIRSGLNAVSVSNEKIGKIGTSLESIIPEMQTLKDFPSAFQPLIQLQAQQHQSLMNAINGMRNDFVERESKFELVENIGHGVKDGLESVLISNSEINEIRNSLRVIAPEIMKLLPALQPLGRLPAQQEALHREILGMWQTLNSSPNAPSVSGQKNQVVMQLQPSVQPQINTEASALP